jgi:RNA polymerase sigma factor (sigma-70 family)
MAARSENLLRCIRRLVAPSGPTEASDAALLGHFLAGRDDRAFAALVDRHAELVFQVCWRVLGDVQDAEDAFQATFLVLARKAASVRPREALPAWLHGVARRVSLKARTGRARRPHAGTPPAAHPVDPHPDPLARLSARELLAIVDEEVQRLPEVYRLPVILCCLEGRTQEEAARQLGWTPGSVKGRLERGRARLQQRLARRGLIPSSAALAAVEVARGASSALAVVRLIGPTVRGALAFATRQSQGGVSASAAATALAREALRGPALAKLGAAAALALATSLLAAGLLTYRTANPPAAAPAALPPGERHGPAARAAFAGNRPGPPAEGDDAPVEVSGFVLGPQGRPVAGARLYVGYARRRSEPEAVAGRPDYPLRATSGPDGRFQFAFARAQLDERYLDASRPVVVAVADGLGLDWAEIGGRDPLRLRLVEDLPLEGRILGPDRRPVAGARVNVREVTSLRPEDAQEGRAGKSCRGPLPGQPPATTDADGRFRLSGVGRDRSVMLAVEGPGIAPAVFAPAGGEQGPGAPFDFVAAAPRPIRGVVRDKATGRPLAGVRVSLQVRPVVSLTDATLTDKDGRYELRGPPTAREPVVAQPQPGQPYFSAVVPPPRAPGPGPVTADFELVRGAPLRGRVTDGATGRPPKRAVVEYYPLPSNEHAAALSPRSAMVPASSSPLGPDGSYSLAVLQGPGIVLVAASPRDSYATARLDAQELAALCKGAADGGASAWAHIADRPVLSPARAVDRYNALALINPDGRAAPGELDFTLHPARPLRGTVVGPDGEPLAGMTVCGLTSMPDPEVLEGAAFTVEGLNPEVPRPLSFYHEGKRLGKALTLRGEQTEVLTVRLEPCGEVIGRVLDRDGRPVAGMRVCFGRPGNERGAPAKTDVLGRFRATLVPELKYRVPRPLTRDFDELEVGPGQVRDLGDLLLTD